MTSANLGVKPAAPNLTSDSIRDLLIRVGIPSAMSFLVGILNNIIDVWFAGNWSLTAQAALGVSFPLFFLIIAVSGGLGQAAGGIVSYYIGAGQMDTARTYVAQGVICAVVSGLLIGVWGVLTCGWALTQMGVSGETHSYAEAYLKVLFAMAVTMSLFSIFSGFLNAQGKTAVLRNISILGLVVNVILNPLLMYGYGPVPMLGPVGLAWATVGANLVMIGAQVHILFSGNCVPVTLSCWRPRMNALFAYIRQGFPPSFNLLMIGVMFFQLNVFLISFGDAVVAGMTIGLRMEQLIILPVVGMSTAILAILGQNLGAGRSDRISEAFIVCLKLNLYFALIGSVMLVLFAPFFVALFTDEPDVIHYGTTYLRISGSIQCAYAVIIFANSVLQGLQRPAFITWSSLVRCAIAPIFIGWIVVSWLKFGPLEFWISLAISNSLFAGLAFWYCLRVLRETTEHITQGHLANVA